jgi:subtilisin family serine protease
MSKLEEQIERERMGVAYAPRSRVSPQIEREVAAQGVSQAVVFLNPPAASATASAAGLALSDQPDDLASCFVKDERSISGAIASAGVSLVASLADASPGKARRKRRVAVRSQDAIPAMRRYDAIGVVLGDVHADGLAKLSTHPRVRYVGSSMNVSLIRPTSVAATAMAAQTTTWGIERLGIPTVWASGLTGQGVKVGHLDTGVDGSHPALRNAIGGFLQTDDNGFPTENAVPAFDTDRHGTHTAGTIAGRPVAGRRIGVAPGATLFSATVIEGGNVVARILAGLDWVARNGVKVLSMSLGLRGFHDDFVELMRALRRAGILPVIASGNEGPGTSRSPGNYDFVLSVGACDENDEVADFSSSQTFARVNDPTVPDIVAPGVAVVSAANGGGHLEMSGTSMATPHVAGLAALLWEAKPTASVDEIELAIFRSCARSTGMSIARANRGLPDAPRAVQLLTGTPLAAPVSDTVRAAQPKAAPRKRGRRGGQRRSSPRAARTKKRARTKK